MPLVAYFAGRLPQLVVIGKALLLDSLLQRAEITLRAPQVLFALLQLLAREGAGVHVEQCTRSAIVYSYALSGAESLFSVVLRWV